MIIRERPVDKIEIKIIQSKVREALPAGFFHLPMLVIPDLRRNEKVLPRDVSLVKQPLQCISDILLVPVYAGAVDQAIACFHRAVNRLRDLLRLVFVRAKRPDADRGNRRPVIQIADRYLTAVIRVFHSLYLVPRPLRSPREKYPNRFSPTLYPHSGKTTATFPHCPDAIS